MKRWLIAILACSPLLMAASKHPSPPAPQPGAPHYLYAELGIARWRVGMIGAGAFDAAEIERSVLHKAAKITLSRGFDWFEPIGEPAEPVFSENGSNFNRPPEGMPPNKLYLVWSLACPEGRVISKDPTQLCDGGSGDATPFQATTQILMGHGATPQNGIAIDAHVIEPAKPHAWPSLPHVWPGKGD